MDYIGILKRAWEITWRYKALWLFGFLLALISGSSGMSQSVQYVIGRGGKIEPTLILAIAFFVLIFVLAFIVIGLLLGYLSRGALIGMVHEVEETSNTSVHSGWRIGWSRFLPLLAIDLVIGIPAVIVAFILITLGLSPLILLLAHKRALTVLAIVLTVFFVLLVVGLLIIAGVVLSVVCELAYRQCVLGRRGILDSIREGYRMGRDNLRHIGTIWLLLCGIGLAAGFVAIPLFLGLMAVAVAPGIFTYFATEALIPALLVGIPPVILAFLLLTLLEGVYQVFRSTTWTLAYLALETQACTA